MGNSFIERLTDEQIREFLSSRFLIYRYTFTRKVDSDRPYIAVSLYSPEGLRNYVLEDYSSTIAQEHWHKYLYQIFGEDYYASFRKGNAKITHFKVKEAV